MASLALIQSYSQFKRSAMSLLQVYLLVRVLNVFFPFQSRHNTEEFTLFTLDDVDMAFDKIETLKYSQSLSLKGTSHILQCSIWYVVEF